MATTVGDSRRMAMLQAMLEQVLKLPASEYLLSEPVSGLGPAICALQRNYAQGSPIKVDVQKILRTWKEVKHNDQQLWKSIPVAAVL